jgi:hypothetical protein
MTRKGYVDGRERKSISDSLQNSLLHLHRGKERLALQMCCCERQGEPWVQNPRLLGRLWGWATLGRCILGRTSAPMAIGPMTQ